MAMLRIKITMVSLVLSGSIIGGCQCINLNWAIRCLEEVGGKKKRVKKVKVGGLAIILTGTESRSNLNIAKHCWTTSVCGSHSLTLSQSMASCAWVSHTSTLKVHSHNLNVYMGICR